MRIIIFGVGNPGRQDDGLGYALIKRGQAPISLEIGACPPLFFWNYQLNIEDAHTIKDVDLVVFVDATKEGEAPATLAEIAPAAEVAFSTHALAPASVLALCEELYGRAPKAYVLAIRGYAWDLGEELSARAAANLENALSLLEDFLVSLSNRHSGTAGT